MCGIWKREAENELTLAEIERFFANSNKFSWIDLTGGEVFMREDFLGIVEAILSTCENLYLLHFPTNGLLTKKIVESVRSIQKLKPCRIIVTVSMDGYEELNDQIRGVPGGWKRQMETFGQLYAMPGVEVVLGMTLSPYNYDKFDETYAAARERFPGLEYKDFHVNIAHVSNHYYNNDDMQEKEYPVDEVSRVIRYYMSCRGFPCSPVSYLEWQYLRRVATFLQSRKTPIRCHALHSSCFVDPHGTVYPCGMYDAKIGSLRDHDYNLAEIWNSDRCKEIQAEIWRFKCPQCWTPCEAYQSLLGDLLGLGKRPKET
jgi:MoaA/NifB/PqqE/SkfB family radical SAM enzyme